MSDRLDMKAARFLQLSAKELLRKAGSFRYLEHMSPTVVKQLVLDAGGREGLFALAEQEEGMSQLDFQSLLKIIEYLEKVESIICSELEAMKLDISSNVDRLFRSGHGRQERNFDVISKLQRTKIVVLGQRRDALLEKKAAVKMLIVRQITGNDRQWLEEIAPRKQWKELTLLMRFKESAEGFGAKPNVTIPRELLHKIAGKAGIRGVGPLSRFKPGQRAYHVAREYASRLHLKKQRHLHD
jgi:hypothetical protein